MYKILTIGGKDYKLEYSIEASLYADCAEAATGLFVGVSVAAAEKNLDEMLKRVSNLPAAALSMFYAGLLEHHGTEGDGQVPDKTSAKVLLRTYLKEHEKDSTGDFYGLTTMLMEKMGEDNFFKMIGLEGMLEAGQNQKGSGNVVPIIPQDHKPKNRKASEK